MKLTKKQKHAIESEFKQWTETQYAGKDKKERQKLGQFFTPPALTIKMLEKFDSVKDKDILDPTCGAGGLLVACILAGADPKRIYGIELDKDIREVCLKRLCPMGVPESNIKLGNALDDDAYEFKQDREVTHDQNAVEILEDDVKFTFNILKFPAKVVKTIKIDKTAQKHLADKLVKRLCSAGYWTIGVNVNEDFLKTSSKHIGITAAEVKKLAAKQLLNSYDDILKAI